jgi:glycosyltransferase involved in cell wall biosynthesis
VKLVVATPYPEASTLAIARAAATAGWLDALFVSGLPPLIGRAPLIRERQVQGVPPVRVRSVGTEVELTRKLLARTPGLEGLSSRTMYAGKMAFDRIVAREIPPADAVLGVFASCALTLKRAHAGGSLAVLNFVNSHPKEHNRFLREFGGLRGRNHEFVAEQVVRRVERELELADLVLVPSKFVADQLVRQGFSITRISVIPYGVDLEVYKPPTLLRPAGPVQCLFVGQVSHRKGVPSLLRAARQLPAINFILAGPLVSRDVLRDLPPNVRRIGPMPIERVSALMRASDIFVLPSIEDSYGLVVIEAMASGLPAIVTDHVGASEVINPGQDGLVVPTGDDDALVSAIRRLADDGDLRLQIGRAARDRVSGSHSWTQYATDAIAAVADAVRRR